VSADETRGSALTHQIGHVVSLVRHGLPSCCSCTGCGAEEPIRAFIATADSCLILRGYCAICSSQPSGPFAHKAPRPDTTACFGCAESFTEREARGWLLKLGSQVAVQVYVCVMCAGLIGDSLQTVWRAMEESQPAPAPSTL
jgi:hypothetical protein